MSVRSLLVRVVGLMAVGFAATAVGSAGCGSDESGSGGSGTASSGQGAAGSTSSATGAGGGDCASMIDMTDPCNKCVAMKCMAEGQACCAKPHCLELIECVRKTGCNTTDPTGPDGCLQPDAMGGCYDEIMAATVPVAQGEATALGDCGRKNCPMECGVMGSGGGGGAGGG